MSFVIDDLPTIEEASRLGRSSSADPAVADAYRIPSTPVAELVGSLGISRALEMAARAHQRLFPSPAELSDLQAAAAPSYTMYLDCGPYNYDATCNEACFGFAPHHMDPFYCATCDEQDADPVNNPSYNWTSSVAAGDSSTWTASRTSARDGTPGSGTSASAASVRSPPWFRCHDGWKKYPGSASWDPTICQGIVSCDQRLTLCP